MRRLVLSLAVLAAVAGAACGDPPDKEMQQAQGAIDAARAAGADQYARDEFAAAEDALKRAHDAVDQRDYRQALNTALDARERAQTAAKEAVDKKATARADATKALADADAALHDARAKLKAAETARVAGADARPRRARRSTTGKAPCKKRAQRSTRGTISAAIETARGVPAQLGPGDARSRGRRRRRRAPAALIIEKTDRR